MLERVDRVQMAVPDAAAASANWERVLGAEHESGDRVACLGAKRTTWRVGNGRVEFLEPDGAGAVQDALAAKGGPHLFAAGVSTPDVDELVGHILKQNVSVTKEGAQAYLGAADAGDFGLQVVISREEELPRVGVLDGFYETTLLVSDAPGRVQRCADIFGLDTGNFVPISSDEYGYDGTLTLFQPNRLHRWEIITPTNTEKTMGRFFAKFGECYYMAFAESDELPAIEAQAKAEGLGHTPVRPRDRAANQSADTVFLHPPTLGGMMLGISRRTMAWSWSGQPDKVEPVS